MGGHYGTIHVREGDQEQVRAAVQSIADERTRRFLIAPPINGWVTVFPENNGQDEKISAALAAKLPDKTVIHCLVHDDSLFAYWYFENGALKDRYNSCPDYFGAEHAVPRGGNARAFASLLGDERKISQLQAVLDEERRTIELERQDAFAALLRLPHTDRAYEYLQSGERDGVKFWKKFVHVPDLAPEKSAKRAAAAEERAELKQLKASGTLWVDQLANKTTHPLLFESSFWMTDPVASAVLQRWTNLQTREERWCRFAAPKWEETEWTSPVLKDSSGAAISRGGRWCAVLRHQGRRLEIWNWPDSRKVLEKDFDANIGAIEFSADEKRCYLPAQDRLYGIALDGSREMTTMTFHDQSLLTMAAHPGGEWLALVQGGVLCLFNAAGDRTARIYGVGGLYDFSQMTKQSLSDEALNKMLERGRGQLSPEKLEEIRKHFVKERERNRYQGKEVVYRIEFSADGRWLICGTNAGVRGFAWSKVLGATQAALIPDVSVDAEPVEGRRVPATLIWSMACDSVRNRVLFGGLEGKIRYLELDSGRSGDLIAGKTKVPVVRLALAGDRAALVMTRMPVMAFGDEPRRERFQIWNYAALCRSAGLEW